MRRPSGSLSSKKVGGWWSQLWVVSFRRYSGGAEVARRWVSRQLRAEKDRLQRRRSEVWTRGPAAGAGAGYMDQKLSRLLLEG